MHLNVVKFIKREYPDTLFFTDFAAGLFLPPWLAVKRKQLNAGRGFPDLFILSPQRGHHGLALELKKPGQNLKKRNGQWADERIATQNKVLDRLDDMGYAAFFAVGMHQAEAIINWYFGRGEDFVRVGRVPVIGQPVVTTAQVTVAGDVTEAF